MTIEQIRNSVKDTLLITNHSGSASYHIVKTEDKGEYEQLLIAYEGHEKDLIPAYLLIPKGEGKFPSVLIHHQHNSEWHIGKSEVCGITGDPFNAFGVALAKKGFIVLAPDSVGFEDRRRNQKGNEKNEETDWLQYFNGLAYSMVMGKFLMTTVLNDAIIGFSVLLSHPKVEKERTGILGHSYGGNTCIFHAAVDEQIKFVCASGAACSYKNKIVNENRN